MYTAYNKSITTDELIELVQNSNHEEAERFIAFIQLAESKNLMAKALQMFLKDLVADTDSNPFENENCCYQDLVDMYEDLENA